MRFRGQAEIEINGDKVGFTWNMSALCLLGDIRNKTIQGIGLEMVDLKFSFLADFLYVGYEVYQRKHNITPTQGREYGAEILDCIGYDKAIILLNEAFETPTAVVEEAKKPEPVVAQTAGL